MGDAPEGVQCRSGRGHFQRSGYDGVSSAIDQASAANTPCGHPASSLDNQASSIERSGFAIRVVGESGKEFGKCAERSQFEGSAHTACCSCRLLPILKGAG